MEKHLKFYYKLNIGDRMDDNELVQLITEPYFILPLYLTLGGKLDDFQRNTIKGFERFSTYNAEHRDESQGRYISCFVRPVDKYGEVRIVDIRNDSSWYVAIINSNRRIEINLESEENSDEIFDEIIGPLLVPSRKSLDQLWKEFQENNR